MNTSFALSGDLSPRALWAAAALGVLALVLLGFELFRAKKANAGAILVALTGAISVLALMLAVVRPVAVASRASLLGPKVVVLADASRSIDLPGLAKTRRETLENALADLDKRAADVRLSLLAFGAGPPKPVDSIKLGGAHQKPVFKVRPMLESDLSGAFEEVARSADERPQAIIVLSDGRLDRPGELGTAEAAKAALGNLDVPVHTLALAKDAPADASIRSIHAAGAAVAHQPLSLRVEIGCEHLDCGAVPVTAKELREKGPPVTLAQGTAHVVNGTATIELSLTIDQAGVRIVEVEIDAPRGDTIPENDRRFVQLDVTRDRVRLLHVAGQPTYDVRALRMWLKSDASLDVIAFFILRTLTSNVGMPRDREQKEMALIPFPSRELFTVHLSSFDAVILQGMDIGPRYDLDRYAPNLAKYVENGGGLIVVGGPESFGAGHYVETGVARILPVGVESRQPSSDLALFTPRVTAAGRFAPVLGPVRALVGEGFPEMPGTNVVGDPLGDATVLLEHPWRTTKSGAPMPVLTLGEHGNGRTIALSVDGSHRLLFSSFAANAAGRAHGAFWDAMLGWLMRDPRFEPAVIDVRGGCIAGEPSTLVLRPVPDQKGHAVITITRLGSPEVIQKLEAEVSGDGAPIEIPAAAFEAGGYLATVEIGSTDGKSPSTKRHFACETGGEEWADSRPDPARLEAIAKATGGTYALATDVASIPLPAAKEIAAERKVTALLPAWAWAVIAAFLLGAHWIVRRRGGLA